jgi:hypothetical protein
LRRSLIVEQVDRKFFYVDLKIQPDGHFQA